MLIELIAVFPVNLKSSVVLANTEVYIIIQYNVMVNLGMIWLDAVLIKDVSVWLWDMLR